jgi:hypothetical protein
MSDRTTVFLTLPKLLIKLAVPLFKDPPSDSNLTMNLDYVTYTFEDCNYGELRFADKLTEQGIPHNREWDSGDEYSAGVETVRFTSEGKVQRITIYDGSRSIDIDTLVELINNYEDLKEYILTKQKENEVLPWDNQIEYGRIYRARRLITG